jgi:carboxylesterase
MGEPRALILHGFTGTLETVRKLTDVCDSRNMRWEMPYLRGHGTFPQALDKVTWKDWYYDGEQALLAAAREGPVVIMGLSMGGLVTLDLAGRHPDKVAGVVVTATSLQLKSALLALVSLIGKWHPYWTTREVPRKSDETGEVTHYNRFPIATLESLLDYARLMHDRLHLVEAPILIVQSWSDQVVRPSSARHIYDRVRSWDKELARFEDSEHDMFLGCERSQVCDRIGAWLDARLPLWRGSGAQVAR